MPWLDTQFKADNISAAIDDATLFSQISFRLNAGSALQITGENGVGKTTLLRILAGLKRPSEGEIHWQAPLNFLSHQPVIQPHLTVRENCEFFCALENISSEKISDCLSQLQLEKKQNLLAKFLSSGQQRRLSLARLLFAPQQLWIADEPFTALDEAGISLLENMFTSHMARKGLIIFTSHIPVRNFANIETMRLK